MTTYNIRLIETRLSDSGGDDTAIFSVSREDKGQDWRVATLISPLFRHLHLERHPTEEIRRDTVEGMGVQAIAKRLEDGLPLEDSTYLVIRQHSGDLTGNLEPLGYDEELTVVVGEG